MIVLHLMSKATDASVTYKCPSKHLTVLKDYAFFIILCHFGSTFAITAVEEHHYTAF